MFNKIENQNEIGLIHKQTNKKQITDVHRSNNNAKIFIDLFINKHNTTEIYWDQGYSCATRCHSNKEQFNP